MLVVSNDSHHFSTQRLRSGKGKFLILKYSLLPAATKLGQGNVFTGVCDSVHSGGGVSASVHAGIPHPTSHPGPPGIRPLLEQTPPRDKTPQSRHSHPPGPDPPGADTSLGQDPPGPDPPGANTPLGQDPPGADTPPRTRHIHTPPRADPPPPGKQTPAYGQ